MRHALAAAAVLVAVPGAAQAPSAITTDYIAELFFKGCLGALNNAIDLSNKATVTQMGLRLTDLESVFIKNESGEGALILDRADLLGKMPKQELSLYFYKKSRTCKVRYYGPKWRELQALLRQRMGPLTPVNSTDPNDEFDDYSTPTGPGEALKIRIRTHRGSESKATDVTAKLVKTS